MVFFSLIFTKKINILTREEIPGGGHSSPLKLIAPVKKTLKGQTTLTNAFAPQLPQSSARAKAVIEDIGVFIAPFFLVENLGFH